MKIAASDSGGSNSNNCVARSFQLGIRDFLHRDLILTPANDRFYIAHVGLWMDSFTVRYMSSLVALVRRRQKELRDTGLNSSSWPNRLRAYGGGSPNGQGLVAQSEVGRRDSRQRSEENDEIISPKGREFRGLPA